MAAKGLWPAEHFVDGGYLEADLLVSSAQLGIDLIGPVPIDKTWQAKTDGAFDHSQFQIDWDLMQATCPAGKTSIYQMKGNTRRHSANIHFTFSATDCRPCPFRSKENGRTLTIYSTKQYPILQVVRQRQSTEAFKLLYRTRAGIELNQARLPEKHPTERDIPSGEKLGGKPSSGSNLDSLNLV